jgi:hypothetical protein
MRRVLVPITAAFLILVGIFGWIQTARGQDGDGRLIVKQELQGENLREIIAPDEAAMAEQPNISFIDSPTATCYQPNVGSDECFIKWYYMYVDANPNYMIAMTVTLNTVGPIARVGGFFQTYMDLSYNFFGDGFKVACGDLGAGGNPNLGNAYAYTITARDSANLKSANYGTLYCPASAP